MVEMKAGRRFLYCVTFVSSTSLSFDIGRKTAVVYERHAKRGRCMYTKPGLGARLWRVRKRFLLALQASWRRSISRRRPPCSSLGHLQGFTALRMAHTTKPCLRTHHNCRAPVNCRAPINCRAPVNCRDLVNCRGRHTCKASGLCERRTPGSPASAIAPFTCRDAPCVAAYTTNGLKFDDAVIP
jgi:hypothetical protein